MSHPNNLRDPFSVEAADTNAWKQINYLVTQGLVKRLYYNRYVLTARGRKLAKDGTPFPDHPPGFVPGEKAPWEE